MSENLRDIQERARELASSGKFAGWTPIAFELRFEPGYQEAFKWIHSPATREELDYLCYAARKLSRHDPEAA
jgi:hypothetical protein